MKFIFDNIIFSKQRSGGVSNYWFELIKNRQQDKDVLFYEEQFAIDNIYRSSMEIPNLIAHKQLPLLLSRMLPIKFNSDNDNLLYHSSYYRKLKSNAKICEFVTVHDFIHDYFSSPIEKYIHNSLKYSAIKRSRGIICISNNTYSDLKKFRGVNKDQQVAIIHNGVSDDYFPINDINSIDTISHINKRPFLLFVGARTSYKNFDFVIKLLKELPNYNLVVVGSEFSKSEEHKIGGELLKKITVVQNISNLELNVLYNLAHALVYPSNYEGFGIPVVEAMRAGCPVIALNLSSIPEIAGKAAILIETLNLPFFIKKIKELEVQATRKEYIEAGFENSKRFSWEKCRVETNEFYESVSEKYSAN
jgi:glycosyltransferase involved in cell wall biosynthesis